MASNSSSSEPAHFAAHSKIIIAGAGIAGLSFARALHRCWPSSAFLAQDEPQVTIYERDIEEVSVEREGYSLSIRSDARSGGMQALAKLGLLDEMLRKSITGLQEDQSGGFVLWDVAWNESLKIKPRKPPDGLPVPHMRIARNVLRRVLVDNLPPRTIVRWDTACTSVSRLPNGKVQVHLSNGLIDECDVLIAADGTNSKIRLALNENDRLAFAGAVCISGTARFPLNAVPKPVDRDWGCVLGAGRGTGLFASPIDASSAVWSLSYLAARPRAAARSLTPEKVDELLTEVLERGKCFAEPFGSLVHATDPATLTVFNAMDKQPFTHEYLSDQNRMSVIFIGDANHAISPFAGNGANMALMDGVELADHICKATSLLEAAQEYDKTSVPRSKTAIRTSRWVIDMAHAQGWKLWVYLLLLRMVKFLFIRN